MQKGIFFWNQWKHLQEKEQGRIQTTCLGGTRLKLLYSPGPCWLLFFTFSPAGCFSFLSDRTSHHFIWLLLFSISTAIFYLIIVLILLHVYWLLLLVTIIAVLETEMAARVFYFKRNVNTLELGFA